MLLEELAARGVSFTAFISPPIEDANGQLASVGTKAAIDRGEVTRSRPRLTEVIDFHLTRFQIWIFERNLRVANHATEV